MFSSQFNVNIRIYFFFFFRWRFFFITKLLEYIVWCLWKINHHLQRYHRLRCIFKFVLQHFSVGIKKNCIEMQWNFMKICQNVMHLQQAMEENRLNEHKNTNRIDQTLKIEFFNMQGINFIKCMCAWWNLNAIVNTKTKKKRINNSNNYSIDWFFVHWNLHEYVQYSFITFSHLCMASGNKTKKPNSVSFIFAIMVLRALALKYSFQKSPILHICIHRVWQNHFDQNWNWLTVDSLKMV